MSIHKIIKQKLLSEPFSGDTLKLMKAIYNTYVTENFNLDLEIKLHTILKHLNLDNNEHSHKYLVTLFEDMNEPLKIENFKFYMDEYPVRYVTFCKYKIDSEIVEITLNEEYIVVEKEYMLDSFLSR